MHLTWSVTLLIIYSLLFNFSNCATPPSSVTLIGLFPMTGRLATSGVEREAAARIAIENINNDPTILPDTELRMVTYNTNTTQSGGLTALLMALEEHPGFAGIIGEAASAVSQIVAIAGGVFKVPQLSYSSTAASLSSKSDYPLFSRMVPPDNQQGRAFVELIKKYGWENKVSAISTSDEYGVGGITKFIDEGQKLGVSVKSYQQFLVGAKDISVELRELANSGSRVFLAFCISSDGQTIFAQAKEYNIVGKYYVWLCSDGCSQSSLFIDSQSNVNQTIRNNIQGLVGLTPKGGTGPLFDAFLDDWETRDPILYPGAGDRTINTFAPHAYDCVYTYARVLHSFYTNSSVTDVTYDLIVDGIRSASFTGLTGEIEFESNGDRIAEYDVANIRDDLNAFTIIGTWSAISLASNSTEFGFEFEQDIQWYDKTTNVPDLDIREPFHYWNCHKKEKRYDPTGKAIKLEKPDGNDPVNIDEDYICDEYIDCDNMSDEGVDCSPSYVIAFVIVGIINGIFLLVVPVFIVFAIAFGIIWKKRRIRVLSPVFLIGMCVAAIGGYASVYAWFGKPHTVACNFQPWLLGLSVNLMIAFLFAKTFRIWRIFKSPFVKRKITDFQLFVLVLILMIPTFCILIFWTAFATPKADLKEVDGMDHYVCTTGGLIDSEIAGYVLFSLLVAYTGILLLFGVFLAFVTRNVPEEYSESRFVGYSVYNLTFVGVVVIVVFFVLRESNPIAAWIIRSIAIIYGFTVTLWLQFLPPMVLLVVRDKCMAVPKKKVSTNMESVGGTQSASVS